MAQFTGIRVHARSETEAAELADILRSEGGDVRTNKQIDDTVHGILPVFVWIVFASIIGVASLVEIVIRIIDARGKSVLIWVDDKGDLQIQPQEFPRGLIIIKEEDGDITFVRRSVINLDDLLKTIVESGLGAGAKKAEEAGGKKGTPGEDDDASPAGEGDAAGIPEAGTAD